jgi:hypothetical protein
MKKKLNILLFVMAMVAVNAHAEMLKYQNAELAVSEKARACYMLFVKLYDATYYRNDDGKARCVKLDYLRAFDRDELIEATEKIFSKLHGEEKVKKFAGELDQLAMAYQAVSPGNSYRYCVGQSGAGEMIRDGHVVVRLVDNDFSERLMNIWVIGEEADGKPRWNFSRCPTTTTMLF